MLNKTLANGEPSIHGPIETFITSMLIVGSWLTSDVATGFRECPRGSNPDLQEAKLLLNYL